MATKPIFTKITQKSKFDLPTSLNREIGRVIVRWAYLEHYLQRFIWAVAFLGDDRAAALGRIAIREPRAYERLGLLQQVAEVRGVTYDSALAKSMKQRIQAIGEKRDLVAHGMWTNTAEAGWSVQDTRGTWQPFQGGPRGSKRINPEAVPMCVDDLRKIAADIETLIADAKKLHASLREPTSSP